METTYGAMYVALEYTRSFRPEYLANYLFGCDLACCNSLLIQGSTVPDRNPRAWLADYFGLPMDFDSRVSFCPRIQNVIVDLDFYLGFREKFFFKLQAPIAWTKWELNMCECISDIGDEPFPAGYMSAAAVPAASLPESFIEAMSGTVTWGDMKEEIKFGRMTNCKKTKARLADIRASLGWNFVLDEDHHLGAFLQIAAPTGNRPTACYLFEPIVGNGKHWELGFGITSSRIFWRSKEYSDRYMGFWFDATVTHLFKTCQCRSFDFCCKPNSRYMLLEEMEVNAEGDNQIIAEPDEAAPPYRYKSNLIPAINWSTFNVDVKINAQLDLALKLGYFRENWSFDIGYNLWARTGEKFCLDCCNDCCDRCCGCPSTCEAKKLYAIKGDSYVYGYHDISGKPEFPLTATQCEADIRGGKNYPVKIGEFASLNPRVDSPQLAGTASRLLIDYDDNGQLKSSTDPALVSHCMLNLGKSPSAITHKIFGSFSYAWKDEKENWIPFMGMGWEVEFAQKSAFDECCTDCCKTCCNSCCNSCTENCGTCCTAPCSSCCEESKRAGIFQYGVWFKGGFSFD